MVDKKRKKEANELKQIFVQFLDKRKERIKNTQFKADDVFVDILKGSSISPGQTVKPNNFLNQNDVNKNFSIKLYFVKPRKKEKIGTEAIVPPKFSKI